MRVPKIYRLVTGEVFLLDSSVVIALSDITNGSMHHGVAIAVRDENRRNFLALHDSSLDNSVWNYLVYEGDNYCRYRTIEASSAGDGMNRMPSVASDAVFTREKGLMLFLPIADCIAAVLYDRKNHILGLSHLGRHSLEQLGGTKTVEYMQEQFSTNPSDIVCWLSPAAGKETYPLFAFENRSLHEVAFEQLIAAGVTAGNIDIDSRDTATDSLLFSHSEFLKGNRATDGRQAVITMMNP